MILRNRSRLHAPLRSVILLFVCGCCAGTLDFSQGANFTAAMAFQLASTNLVAELTIIIIVLMGWQFAAAEFLGGALMVVLMALLFRMFLSHKLVAQARAQARGDSKARWKVTPKWT